MSIPRNIDQWLAAQFAASKKKKGDLAKLWGVDGAAISKVLAGTREVSADEFRVAQDFFSDYSTESLAHGIPEIDVRAGAGGGGLTIEDVEPDGNGGTMVAERISQYWILPPSYIRNELRARNEAIRICEVLGDSMEPTLRGGDRILIDTSHKIPSPPGVFAVNDGFGVVVKRVELIPKTSPAQVRLISDNPNHRPVELTIEEAQIIGRVICRISVM